MSAVLNKDPVPLKERLGLRSQLQVYLQGSGRSGSFWKHRRERSRRKARQHIVGLLTNSQRRGLAVGLGKVEGDKMDHLCWMGGDHTHLLYRRFCSQTPI